MTSAATQLFPWKVEADSWLGGVLGYPALRLVSTEAGDAVNLATRLQREKLFLTAKVSAEQVAHLSLLQDMGCRVIDMNLVFQAAPDTAMQSTHRARVRTAAAMDRAAIRTIAETAFTYTRFHLDPDFDVSIANRIKRDWVDNFFNGGRGDSLLVAEGIDGTPQGFLLALDSTDVVIDLIAMAPGCTGQGGGRAMIATLAQTAKARGKRLVVGTQAANIAASRFYEALGFRLKSASYVLHHHGVGVAKPRE